jgi:hypothetical protein
VTSLVTEQFAAPDTSRGARALELTRRRAADELAGRTVWSVGACPLGAAAAGALNQRLRSPGEQGVATRRALLHVGDSLSALVERLEGMLRGRSGPQPALGPEVRETFRRCIDDGDELLGHEVQPGDVVVVHDAVAAALAQALRSRGAHAVWRVTLRPSRGSAREAWRFLHAGKPCVDAYVTVWPPAGMAGFIAAHDVVSAKELPVRDSRPELHHVAWTALLADVVSEDRGETVGGRYHARPTVAVR